MGNKRVPVWNYTEQSCLGHPHTDTDTDTDTEGKSPFVLINKLKQTIYH